MGVVAETADRVLVMYAGRIVEEAPVARLFDHPLHPYTRGLLECVPSLDQDHERLVAIPGTLPDPARRPAGCRFRPALPLRHPGLPRRHPAARHASTRPHRRLHPRRRSCRVTPLIEAAGLTKHFPVRAGGFLHRHTIPLRAVDDVALASTPARRWAWSAKSGCGKSTLGRLLIRLIPPTAGNILFDGTDITRLDPAANCARSGARCRSSSRTRTARSIRACRWRTSSWSRC